MVANEKNNSDRESTGILRFEWIEEEPCKRFPGLVWQNHLRLKQDDHGGNIGGVCVRSGSNPSSYIYWNPHQMIESQPDHTFIMIKSLGTNQCLMSKTCSLAG